MADSASAPVRQRFQRTSNMPARAMAAMARSILFAPEILRFVNLVLERPALAFQSLYFRWGSRQDIHQDTAFVKVSSPMEMVASWVALEDIQTDSGELE
jgi:phytanoyl-CoA hydroxylase